MTLRLCGYPGCRELGKHSHYDRQYRQERPSPAKQGYGRRWQRLRAMKLNQEPLCRICALEVVIMPATEVDHIIPKAQGGLDTWDNLQSLCKSHHSEKTYRETLGNKAR